MTELKKRTEIEVYEVGGGYGLEIDKSTVSYMIALLANSDNPKKCARVTLYEIESAKEILKNCLEVLEDCINTLLNKQKTN